MFFKREGKPEPKELVVCTVKKVLPHAAFVYLDEYNNLEAMLFVFLSATISNDSCFFKFIQVFIIVL